MRVKKEPIDPQRIRTTPREGFSWIDRRFIRGGVIDRLSSEAILLYFFLIAVSDARGLSYYADPTVAKLLKLDHEQINQARSQLIDDRLILYRYPLYQVLPLPQQAHPTFRPRGTSDHRGSDFMSLKEFLRWTGRRDQVADGQSQ